MPLNEIVQVLIATLLTGVLAWAAISDVRDRRIPNRAVLAVLALSLPWLFTGVSVGSALAAGLLSLAVCFALFWFGLFGAGDAKLFFSVALFAGLGHLPVFIIVTALAGGAIAAASLVTRPTRAFVMLQMRGKGEWGRGIPYGVAIAIGGVLVLWTRIAGLELPSAAAR